VQFWRNKPAQGYKSRHTAIYSKVSVFVGFCRVLYAFCRDLSAWSPKKSGLPRSPCRVLSPSPKGWPRRFTEILGTNIPRRTAMSINNQQSAINQVWNETERFHSKTERFLVREFVGSSPSLKVSLRPDGSVTTP
jgi:hypothetical protein